tara:strand:+ start:252 stop:998 length:747 start_codon:yes stop_codon:yes gene_type:complete
MSRAKPKPLALTIAGSDSSGGAGLQADLATFLALGVDGASVVTAITAQTPKKVLGIDPVKPTIVLKQLEAVFAGKKPKAAKSGMLLSAGVVECVADFFGGKNRPPLVVDPVMVSSSGAELLRSGGLRALKKKLLPLATVVTPNVPEAEVLAGMIIREPEDMRAAARALFDHYGCAAVVTGGHLPGREVIEVFHDGRDDLLLSAPRVKGGPWHGTGCRFSAVIAAELAKGKKLAQAVVKAKEHVANWIA